MVVGFIRLLLAYFLAAVYRRSHIQLLGRQAIRLCCKAFLAGAGLDDGAMEIARSLGEDAIPFFNGEAQRRDPHGMIAALMLTMLRPE